jgi:hypothetical protein
MKKNILSIACFFLFITLSSFTFCKRQGIRGHVYLIKGNQMPSPDRKPSAPRGLKTTVYVYELTNISQVKQVQGTSFYESVGTKLVKEVMPDEKGYFKIRLNPGQYSLFIKKDNLFYANLFDDKNNICPVKVEKGGFTEIDIRADYDAVY